MQFYFYFLKNKYRELVKLIAEKNQKKKIPLKVSQNSNFN